MHEYLFPTGVIREVEKKLFNYNDMERMIDAEDVNQSFKIFNDLSYADELLDMGSPEQYREVLAHDLGQVKNFILTITPDPKVIEFILAPYDFHNLRIIFKARLAGKNEIKHTTTLGTISPEKFIKIILADDRKETLPDDYSKLISQAKEEILDNYGPQEIDSYFDQKYFAFVLKKALKIKDKFLINLVKRQIDIANIKIIIRSKLLGRSLAEVKRDFIFGGNLDSQGILAKYEKELAGLVKDMEKVFPERQLACELNKFLEQQEFWRLEKALDDYLVRLINETKMQVAGPAIIVAYFLAKKNAIKNIRTVMTGKINNIKAQEIKTRVRELY